MLSALINANEQQFYQIGDQVNVNGVPHRIEKFGRLQPFTRFEEEGNGLFIKLEMKREVFLEEIVE